MVIKAYYSVMTTKVDRETQEVIQARYPGKLEKVIKEMCPRCGHYSDQCVFGLVPLTIGGDFCPYYK